MKLKIVSPTGLVKDVKVVNAETNEMLDDVKEFTIHAKSNMGLVEVSIKFSRLAFEVTAEKKKRTKKPKYPDSTAYSKSCIEANKKTVMDGEGRVDLDYVENHGVNPNDRLSWYMWRYFIKIYSENKTNLKESCDSLSRIIQLPFNLVQAGVDLVELVGSRFDCQAEEEIEDGDDAN